MKTNEQLEAEVAALGGLSRSELAARWEKAYGSPPPKGINRTLLERAAACRLQAERLGGLSAAARAVLRAGRKEMERAQARVERSAVDRAAGPLPVSGFPEGRLPARGKLPRQKVQAPELSCEASAGATESVCATRAGSGSAKPLSGDRAASASPPLAIGTRLMREWNGRMHVVDVTEEGVLFDGKRYRSLTAVAKRITGAHWSGPRFFGL